jgi:NADH-quinone oxidoreductase subunit N
MYPIIATTAMGIIMMFSGILFKEKKGLATLACILLAVLLGVNIYELMSLPKGAGNSLTLFNNMLRIDKYSQWFNTLMTGCTFLYALLVGRDIMKVGGYVAEYFALIFFILCGIYLLSGYNTLLILFLGIEILSIPQYVLAGADKKNLKSSEASLKYFLMGAFSTGILLMGIALLYGATGRFTITEYDFLLSRNFNPMALAGILLLLISFGFKVSAAPMHLWTPDVYDGSPTPFTAYMSTVVKAAAFFAFLRLFQTSFGSVSSHWTLVLSIITAATLLVGNVTAVFQQSVKRMLAYSSIAQAGFMLFAVIGINAIAWQGIIIYAVAYSVASIGMFAVLMKLKDYTYDGFNGLAKREPGLAFVTTIFICSLAGIPLTGGFMAKYYMLYSLMQQGQFMWLVIFALLMAAISAYYYFRVIIAMYFKTGTPEFHEPIALSDRVLLGVTAAIVILIGVMPQLLLQVVSK